MVKTLLKVIDNSSKLYDNTDIKIRRCGVRQLFARDSFKS